MALSMAAMMAPSAAPFFIGYGRDTRRASAVALAFLIYAAVWALIGFAVDGLMSLVMMPSSTLIVIGATAFAGAYMLMPWSRHARARCREMCHQEPRRGAVHEGAVYSAYCVVCSAGVMVALVVIGMTNVVVLALGAAVMLAYKVI